MVAEPVVSLEMPVQVGKEPLQQSSSNVLPVIAEKPKLKSVIVSDRPVMTAARVLFPAAPFVPPPAPVIPVLSKVLNFISKIPASSHFIFLTVLDIDYDTIIPPYFNDRLTLARLVLILPPQINEPVGGLSSLLEEEEEEDVVEISDPDFTPRKRRATRAKEQIDDRFLRRSKRNAANLDGFKSPQSAERRKRSQARSP